MMAKLLSLPALLLVLGVSARADDKPADLDKLQGTWTAESVVYNGKDFYSTGRAKLRFVVKGDQVTVEGNDDVKQEYAKFTVKLDRTTMPRLLDIQITGGSQKDNSIEGIYEVKDDEWRICARINGNERPTEFKSEDGSSVVLVVLKREKP